jgi:hypothetical protein
LRSEPCDTAAHATRRSSNLTASPSRKKAAAAAAASSPSGAVSSKARRIDGPGDRAPHSQLAGKPALSRTEDISVSAADVVDSRFVAAASNAQFLTSLVSSI